MNWPEKILHLVPLLDGSVLQLIVNDDKTIDVSVTSLDPAEIDEKKIGDLVDQLSDPDASKRIAAFDELNALGAGDLADAGKIARESNAQSENSDSTIARCKNSAEIGKHDAVARAAGCCCAF